MQKLYIELHRLTLRDQMLQEYLGQMLWVHEIVTNESAPAAEVDLRHDGKDDQTIAIVTFSSCHQQQIDNHFRRLLYQTMIDLLLA